jgi:hypothetical protein
VLAVPNIETAAVAAGAGTSVPDIETAAAGTPDTQTAAGTLNIKLLLVCRIMKQLLVSRSRIF